MLILVEHENNQTENNQVEDYLKVVKSKETRKKIIERCGENPVADGIECTNCGCPETFKDRNDRKNVDKWYFMIRAFRVDDSSECTNCKKWFSL